MVAYGQSDVGIQRHTNQDTLYYQTSPLGSLPNLFIVADGMGGHKAGDVASHKAVETIVSFIAKSTARDPVSVMEKAIEAANAQVLLMSRESSDFAGMGTTLVMATVFDDVIYIANIGDSRLYLIDEDIRQVTRDHSYVEELVMKGTISRESARNHRRKNELTRALGVENIVTADFFEVKNDKSCAILMCTDGLTNMVEDEMIRRIVSASQNVEEGVAKLIEMANRNGGMDNITALLIEE